MYQLLKPVEVPSLPKSVVEQIERLILQGQVKPGQKIPSERELAARLGVSRPVVHAALVELEQKGLVTIRPRHGCSVNDFRVSGSAELLTSLWRNGDAELEPAIVESVIEFRVAVEQEAAASLARVADAVTYAMLTEILDRADGIPASHVEQQADIDYEFHFTVAMQSKNLIYPMVMNSFREVYIHLLRRFFADERVVALVRANRRALVDAIIDGNAQEARRTMHDLSELRTYER